MADRQANIWLRLKNAKGVSSGLKRLGGGFLSVGKRAVGSIAGIGRSLLSLKTLILTGLVYGALRLLRGVLSNITKAYMTQQDAVKLLNTNLQSQGNYTAAVSARLREQAAALQKVTAYGDEQIVQGQALLASYGGTAKEIERMTPIVLNFAAATGQELKSAFDLAGKASVGYTGTLSRYGIIIDENIPKAKKFEAALVAMAQRGGNAAAEMAKNSSGKLQQMQNLYGDIKEKVAGFLLESDKTVGVFGRIKSALASANEWLVKHKDAIQVLADKGLGVLAKAATSVWNTLKGWAKDGTFFKWLEYGINAVKALKAAFLVMGGAIKAVYYGIKTAVQGLATGILWLAEKAAWAYNKLTGKGEETMKKLQSWRKTYGTAAVESSYELTDGLADTYDKLLDIGSSMNDTSRTMAGWQKSMLSLQKDITGEKDKTAKNEEKAADAAKKTLELTKEQKGALADFGAMGKLKQMAVVDLLQRRKGMTAEGYGGLGRRSKELISGYAPLGEKYESLQKEYGKQVLSRGGVTDFSGIDLTKTTPEKIEATAKVEVVVKAGEDIAEKVGETVGEKWQDLVGLIEEAAEKAIGLHQYRARAAAIALKQAG